MAAKMPKTLEDIKLILSTFREAGVLSFEYGGVKATFDPYAQKKGDVEKVAPQNTIDDKAAQAEELRALLKDAADDEQQNFLWST